MTTMLDSVGTSSFVYDPRSLLIGKTDSGNLSQAYTYDQNGNRITLVDPSDGVRTSTYDALDRVWVYENSLANSVTTQYDANSRPTTEVYESGLVRITTFDPAGQTTGRIDKTPLGVVSSEFTFAYDPAGNRTVVQDLLSLTSYSYDAKNRLVEDNTSGTNVHEYTYTYDPNDNRLSSSETGSLTFWTYDPANRMVTAVSGSQVTTYGYSLNGNVTSVNSSSGLISMSYDKENRLAVYESGSSVTSYVYGGDNLKRLEIAGAAITTLIWDGDEYLGAKS